MVPTLPLALMCARDFITRNHLSTRLSETRRDETRRDRERERERERERGRERERESERERERDANHNNRVSDDLRRFRESDSNMIT